MDKNPKQLVEGEVNLPNGCTLYYKTNEVGCRTYISDEIGGGCEVWNTALVDRSTLLAALTHEEALRHLEAYLQRDAQIDQQKVDRCINDDPNKL